MITDDVGGICPECGETLPPGGSCMDRFHALLALEAEIPGGPGERPHFLAVASYGVQHPVAMGYTVETVTGLRRALADVLGGTVSLEALRRRVRADADRAGRVTRRTGDRVPAWPVADWPLTVGSVLERGPQGYASAVERWARAVVGRLDGLDPTDAPTP